MTTPPTQIGTALVLLAFFVAAPRAALLAADQAREAPVTVFVDHSGIDEVGRSLSYAVREQLRGSRGFPLVSEKAQSAVVVHIISVESSCSSRPAARSAVSFVVVVNNSSSTFLTARVAELGSAEVAEEAKYIVAKIDSEIAAWRARGR